MKPERSDASLYARPRLLPEVVPDEELVVDVWAGAAEETTVARVVGATLTGASVVVGCSTATGVVEVVGAGGGGVEVD